VADKCTAVLKGGIFDVIHFRNSRKLAQDYEEWLRTASRQEIERATKLGLDIEIPAEIPIPLGLDFSNEDWNEFETARNSGKKWHFDEAVVTDTFMKLASKDVLQAWVKCIEITTEYNGWKLSAPQVDADHSTFVWDVKWTPPGANPRRARVHRFDLKNARLRGEAPASFKPHDLESLQFDIIDKHKVAIVTIRNDQDDIKVIIPGILPSPAKPPAIPTIKYRLSILDNRSEGWDFLGGPPGPMNLTVRIDGNVEHQRTTYGGYSNSYPINDQIDFDRPVTDETASVSMEFNASWTGGGATFGPSTELVNLKKLKPWEAMQITGQYSTFQPGWGPGWVRFALTRISN